VYFASCAPPLRYPNVYGIDLPARNEMVAYGRTEEEIAEAIGADRVVFQRMDDLVESTRKFNPEIKRFDCSVFDGNYVTGGITEEYFKRLEEARNDDAKECKELQAEETIGLHNSFQK